MWRLRSSGRSALLENDGLGWKGTVNIEGLKVERSLGAILESERMVRCTLTP